MTVIELDLNNLFSNLYSDNDNYESDKFCIRTVTNIIDYSSTQTLKFEEYNSLKIKPEEWDVGIHLLPSLDIPSDILPFRSNSLYTIKYSDLYLEEIVNTSEDSGLQPLKSNLRSHSSFALDSLIASNIISLRFNRIKKYKY